MQKKNQTETVCFSFDKMAYIFFWCSRDILVTTKCTPRNLVLTGPTIRNNCHDVVREGEIVYTKDVAPKVHSGVKMRRTTKSRDTMIVDWSSHLRLIIRSVHFNLHVSPSKATYRILLRESMVSIHVHSVHVSFKIIDRNGLSSW